MQTSTPHDFKVILETALLAASAPLNMAQLQHLFNDELASEALASLLQELQSDWEERGIELVQLASGWRFQTRTSLQPFLDRLKDERAPHYSRATVETLAIIAYRQPVTRGDIEAIRGVAVSSAIIKTLESRAWIDVVGQRDTPGRPALFATTQRFLDDFGLRKLTELPVLTEIERIMNLDDQPQTPAPLPPKDHDSLDLTQATESDA